jgi:hypothetical protein
MPRVLATKALLLRGAVVAFDGTKTSNPITYETGKEIKRCAVVGRAGKQTEARFVLPAVILTQQKRSAPAGRKHSDKLDTRTQMRANSAPASTKLPVKIVEMTVDAYGEALRMLAALWMLSPLQRGAA